MGNVESQGMENENAENGTLSQQTRRQRRRRRSSSHAATTSSTVDNSWWWSIENENLILNQVPNELASLENASESENLENLENSCRILQKFGDENVNLTLKNISNSDKSTINSNFENQLRIENDKSESNKFQEINCLESAKNARPKGIEEREQTLDEFREELRLKRIARQTAVQNLRDEISTLRKKLSAEQALTHILRQKHEDNTPIENLVNENSNDEDCIDNAAASASAGAGACALDIDDIDPMSRGRHANIELANAQLALQLANSENISLRAEIGVVQKQVGTLKEVISCCKQMLAVKEEQCNELKAKLTEIETTFREHETKIMSENLRHEYERQLGNIRQLRELYEERQRISAAEHENLQRLISIKKDELLAEQEKTKNFEERNQTLIKEVESANKELATLREECNEHKFEKKALKEEMGAVNTLFSQMVMGFNGKNNLDIDRLTTMLEENRSLLNEMATKEVSCTDGATLPKLLFELVEQATLQSNKASRCSTPLFHLDTSTSMENENENENENEDEAAAVNEEINHHNENATANINNDVVKNVENADAVECATSICNGAMATNQVNTETDCNSYGISKSQQQRKSNSKNNNNKTNSYANASLALSSATSSSFTTATPMNFHEPEVIGKVASTQEIIGNLPKVWKVLMELLSHHRNEQVQFEENGNSEDCYKSVETPNGPKPELSVSKTYIKLKDLILEKKSLVKETNRLKTLNSHLECRLNTQEKRLSAVSLELKKTWHLVGKMQRQHRQLHTQEQILRYQLQQKRRLLSELKEELEYCRRKWAAARAKNDESQEQCNDLRREFARRKLEDANNSAESGYSDSGPPSDEEERSGAMGECLNSRRKHLREMFEHTRKIKRMQSTSPGRAAAYNDSEGSSTRQGRNVVGNGGYENNTTEETEIVLRWNSAPPTCGWLRRDNEHNDNNVDDDDADGDVEEEIRPRMLVVSRGNNGAIPKQYVERGHETLNVQRENDAGSSTTERASRIQRLEEQCKSLIQQVLETSDNRERLEVQLCRFQDEIAPVQYAMPLEEFISRRRNERMSRASSAPATATGALTPREEEYTRKRSERLERLEEESRQLMSRIKRTSDRGHYLRCSLDRIRRTPIRQECDVDCEPGDIVKATTVENEGNVEQNCIEKSPLTVEEEAVLARRSERLSRLEQEGQQLLRTLSQRSQQGNALENRLDKLHERYGPNETKENSNTSKESSHGDSKIAQRLESINQITANRAERLRALEEEGNQLIARLSNTSERGTLMINRIAEREQRREARMNATANTDTVSVDASKTSGSSASAEQIPATSALLPTLKNVACSSIVSDEVTECVTVTTTPSRVATRELGAVPKSEPLAKLHAARHKSERFSLGKDAKSDNATCSTDESLEDMIRRLRDTPFPEQQETENAASNQNDCEQGTESSEDKQKESNDDKKA